ncbi:MAG: prephenate dehydrogenase/arogenate dehydrogenase family protein [Proteobacteria bacterium]|nr:prephenate dehydrogenase/arogenate dehydrogenase family protein [Pseudomonadota bacterium]
MKPDTVSIVGGLGRMGALMARIFRQAGLEVAIHDAAHRPIDWMEAARADLVLIAVPIPVVQEVIENLGPHTRPDGVVIDIASLKEIPVKSMLEHCRGEVIGSHPLFGPAVSSLQDQIVFVHPARSEHWYPWFCAFLEERGARVIDIEPARHDRLMSRVQLLRHLFLFCFGRSLMRLDFDLKDEMPLSGPWFKELVGMLDHQLGQAPELYADLTVHNPAAEEVAGEFLKAADEVAGLFCMRDRSKIVELINDVSSYLQTAATGRGASPAPPTAGRLRTPEQTA